MSNTNNSTYLNVLISKFNKTIVEIKDKMKKIDELNEILDEFIVSTGHSFKVERATLIDEVRKLKIRAETLKEIIIEMKENEENE